MDNINKFKSILKTEFNVDCTDISEIHIGLSAAVNYKIKAGDKAFFLKVYDRKKSQFSLWTENINSYMPVLLWLNENTKLAGRIVRPLKTIKDGYRFDDDESVFLLFEYIEGEAIEANRLTNQQVMEAAEIIDCLHNCNGEIPVSTEKIKEDFSVPFCLSLEKFILHFPKLPDDVKEVLQPYLKQLIIKNNELKSLADTVKQKDAKMALCHTDAHYMNFMQSEHLNLVDWEGMKLAPVEADLFMFTQKRYWDNFISHYKKLRPEFVADNEMLSFYVLRRKIEDIWAFLESIMYDKLSDEQRKSNLAFVLSGCKRLDDSCFEL